MNREIKAPSVGESITEVRVGNWKKQNGDAVKAGEVLLEIESDKATVEVVAEVSGALTIARQAGETVKIGEVLGSIAEGASGRVSAPAAGVVSAGGAPASAQTLSSRAVPGASAPASGPASAFGAGAMAGGPAMPLSPAVRKAVVEAGINAAQVPATGRGGRITKGDVLNYQEARSATPAAAPTLPTASPTPAAPSSARERRVPMSTLRQRIAERLVMAQRTAAILTTFNEIDMTNVMAMRAQHKDAFKDKTGVGLSYMSFFTRAVVEALKAVQAVNASIDGKDMVFHDYHDIGIAVGTERGLVVPVLRDAGGMGFTQIEKEIAALAAKARDGKLSIKELTGGTFTISNGGTYGSLLSTPILNPPQSGILGMHKIQERPMALNGQVVARPMMYVALSYDHRIIDGKEAVTFLIKVKEGVENPQSLGFEY